MRNPLATVTAVLLGVFLLFLTVEKGTMLYEEFVMQSLIIEKDRDLLQRCQTPEGYANMNHHPNFCEKIISAARVGAFWHALHRVSSSLPVRDVLSYAETVSWRACLCFTLLSILIALTYSVMPRGQAPIMPYYLKEVS